MTIDDYIIQRNDIQLKAENIGREAAEKCWDELAVANRHIHEVLCGNVELQRVEKEIVECLDRARKNQVQ